MYSFKIQKLKIKLFYTYKIIIEILPSLNFARIKDIKKKKYNTTID